MKTSTGRLSKSDVERAMVSPVMVFDHPSEVVSSVDLTQNEKIELLKRWELDARALQRASDENMTGGEPPELDAVNEALARLDPCNTVPERFGKAPTKI